MSINKRPLSPHLQVYRPQLTSVLSILHRITGFGLAAGVLLALWWFCAIIRGPASYEIFYAFSKNIVGQGLLLCWLFALAYHSLNGVRHLFWDAGYGLELNTAYKSGWAVFFGAVIITALLWITWWQV